MPYGSIILVPGVNIEATPTLLQTGYSASNLIRFKDTLGQKLGGWVQFYPSPVAGIPRALHAWQDLRRADHLAVGTTTQFSVITSGVLQDITPQSKTTDFAPNFSTVITTPTVTIVDSNVSTVTVYDSIFFNTPVSVGGIILSGSYQIVTTGGPGTYTITAATNATATVNNGGAVPVFGTTSGSALVSVTLNGHGLSTGSIINFPISTTVGGVTIMAGSYSVTSVTSVNIFNITLANTATSTTSASMNGGNAELVYAIVLQPTTIGGGFGDSGFGDGGFGTGLTPSDQTGTPITATNYSIDNWGQLVVFCPRDGGLYYWDPTGGFQTASQIVGQNAPAFNTGVFVSITVQIMIAYGSTIPQTISVLQDPLIVKWSDLGNFFEWRVTDTTQAGSYRLTSGSKIVGGMPADLKNLIWTDTDLWVMTYINQPLIFGFDMIGAGAGLISNHAVVQIRGNTYWMGPSNFYSYTSSGGLQVLFCPVWDVVFQDLDTANVDKVHCVANTPFNEVYWFFPSLSGGTGECDKYVKVNILEQGNPWDFGTLQRSTGIDQSVLGNPIMAGSSPALIFQHEETNNADGQALSPSFTTGYFMINPEGQDFAFVDQILPDFKFGTFAGSPTASMLLTFNVVDFPGDTPRTYGPYTFTSSDEYITTRFRGRQMSVTVASNDLDSFWRLGRIRYRWAPVGRR